MCIIVVKPEKVTLTRNQCKIMWDSNPHGAGFMYAMNGEVVVVKGLMTLNDLMEAMEDAGPLRKMVLHFRVMTHGAIGPDMTHPFWVAQNSLAMVHNGVIRPLVDKTTELKSDTFLFAAALQQNYSDPLVAVKSSFHRSMLEAYIGSSKVVFMDGTGETWILNEHLGEWSKNCWYSNDKYRPYAPLMSVRSRMEEMTHFEWKELTAEHEKKFPALYGKYSQQTDSSDHFAPSGKTLDQQFAPRQPKEPKGQKTK